MYHVNPSNLKRGSDRAKAVTGNRIRASKIEGIGGMAYH